MALLLDLRPGDELVIPPNANARLQVLSKSGQRTRVAVDSDERIHVVRGKTASHPSAQRGPQNVQRTV